LILDLKMIENNITYFTKYKTEFFSKNDNNRFLIKLIVGINKLNLIERLVVYLSFFATFIFIIYLMSKCNVKYKLLKKRHQQYGFYISYKYEKRLRNFNQYIFLFLANTLRQRFSRSNKNLNALSTKPYSKLDIGHFNEIFEIEKFDSNFELPSIEITEIKEENQTNENASIKSGEFNFLKAYLNNKKINSFSYKRLKSKQSDNDSFCKNSLSLLSNDESSSSLNFFKSYSSLNKIFTSKNKQNSKQSQVITEKSSLFSSSSSSLPLPTILITDTSSMHTSIIDLENFEPDNYSIKFNSSQSLLNYYFQEQTT
jgi:hypothetical protein